METASWRELLRVLISDSTERDRIATAAGVRSITLTRWINGDSRPRSANLSQLIRAIPAQHQRQFQELLEQEEGPLSVLLGGETYQPEEIPFALVDEILRTRSNTPDPLRFWAISRMILQHALRHLDPESLGMAITVVCCMPPARDGKIHSLREITGYGTSPWKKDLESETMFLGAESLSGHVVTTCQPASVATLLDDTILIPSRRVAPEVSAAAAPLLEGGRVAGCLLFSSTQPNYFASRFKQVQSYTNLMALAFDSKQFYSTSLLDLKVMPALSEQQKHIAGFQRLVQHIMRTSLRKEETISYVLAEQMAWQQTEEALLHVAESRDTATI
jgi:succinate dehydrogenase flavin-adding protein (antitoxin of CptAB toxin-antitoxin module)